MSSIYIPIHSFSDLITNSSSETYVSVTNATVDAFKKIIDASIMLGGGTKKADDLFTFEFCYDYYAGWIKNIQELIDLGIDASELDGYNKTIKITDAELELIKNKLIKKYPPKNSYYDGRCHYNADNRFLRFTPKNMDDITQSIATTIENIISTIDASS